MKLISKYLMYYKKYIFLISLFIFSISVFSQENTENKKVTALLKVLESEVVDTLKIKALNDLCLETLSEDATEAAVYAEKALLLSQKINCKKGIGNSYNNLGNAFLYQNKFDSSLSYYLKALDVRQSIDDKKGIGSTYSNLASVYSYLGKSEKALAYNKKSLEINIELDDKVGIAISYYTIGSFQEDLGNYVDGLESLERGLEISIEIDYKEGQSSCYNVIGIIYDKLGNYKKALDNYLNGLKINEQLGDKTAISNSYNNIGGIFEKMRNLDDALAYYEKCLLIKREIENQFGIADVLNNIGNIYTELAEVDTAYVQKALDNYEKSLNIANEIRSARLAANTYSNIATLFKKNRKFQEAIINYEKSLEIREIYKSKNGIASESIGIGECYFELAQYNKAVKYLEKAYNIGKELKSLRLLNASANLLALSYSKLGNHKKAFDFSIVQNEINQLSRAQENTEKVKLLMQYEYNKTREKEQFKQKEKDLASAAEIKRQKVLIYSALIVILLMVMLSIVIFRNSRLMHLKNKLLASQKNEIEQKNRSITDSITYASKIQQALLPTDDFGGNFISDHFILLKPRDIVSGDFYWVRQKGSKILISAADCTGHGVPGALMSMLGISFLNDILNNTDIDNIHADIVLNELRAKVKHSLQQRGKENEAQDGMDMALCIIDTETFDLEYAGAYNPLYLIRNGELTRFKPDRMPIGIYVKEKESFTKYEVKLQAEDTLYLFSDGYVDQFDETGEHKFMSKNFKQLLLDIQNENLKNQKAILEQRLKDWQGNSEQIDDILVMGLKIS